MLPSTAANLPLDLILDEYEDENKELKEFYENSLPSLFNCPWDLINYEPIRKIAVMIEDTLPNLEDWRLYATAMKIDNDTIRNVNVSAFCHRDRPIFIIMDKILREKGTFGHIIYALLENDRFDILREMAPFVRSLLLKIPQRQIKSDVEGNCTIKKNSASFTEHKYEIDNFQQHSLNESFKNVLKMSDSSKLPVGSSEEIKRPTAPEEDKITVLLQHSESENSIAEQLSSELSKEGVIATTLTDVINFFHFEPENVLKTIFREMDFIVPILSNNLIEEMHPPNSDQYLESIYAQTNRKLYTLIMYEYDTDRCVNKRVRPVIVEGMNRKLVTDPIFRFSFRLPKEVPKLIKVLKETKERARYLV